MSAGNVVTLTPQDIQRRRLEREGRSVHIEFFCAPGVAIADATLRPIPDDIEYSDVASWMRQFAEHLDKLEEPYAKDPSTDR